MKKLFLFLAAALIAVSASAGVRPSLKVNPKQFESNLKVQPIGRVQVNPNLQNMVARQLGMPASAVQAPQTMAKAPRKEAMPENSTLYTATGYFYTWYGMYYLSGLADQVSIDGNDVYFKTLFPYDYTDLVTKGTLNEAGDEITISQDVIGTYYDTYDLVPGELIVDEEGNITGYKQLVLKKDGNRIYVDDDVDNPTRYITLLAFLDGEFAGYLTYELGLDLNVLEGDNELVKVPETATTEQYTYAYTDAYGAQQAGLYNVATDGNDVYFDGLTFGLGWVKGTRNGDVVTVPSGQFLGGDTGYYLWFDNCANFGYDEEGYTTFDVLDNYTLNVNGSTYTQADYDDTPALLTADGELYNYTYDYTIEPFTGLKPAIPADPNNLYIYDYSDYYGQFVLGGSTPNVDVNGKYMDPSSMALSIWEDGDMLTFTADDGYYLSEDVTWMPYGWTDDYGGYDLGYTSFSPYVYLYESLFSELGMQIRYTVDGVTTYSNIVYVDIDGNTRTKKYTDNPVLETEATYAEGEGEAAATVRFKYDIHTAFVNPYVDPAVIKVYDAEGNAVASTKKITDDYCLADYSCSKNVCLLDNFLTAGEYTIVFPAGTVVMGEGINVEFNSEDIVLPISVDEEGGIMPLIAANHADAINSVKTTDAKGVVYNIAGQRVNKMQKGLYIQAGKKYMNK